MKITGIICEYNPFHLGHQRQIDLLRQQEDMGIVCLMSGNFVQRGEPAIFDKMYRAKAAVLCGADLVLELPVTASLSSAEGFAAKGVEILGKFCTHLSFGAETPDKEKLTATAQTLLSPDFSSALQEYLSAGLSFPAARQKALESMAFSGVVPEAPNDILAVEYLKAIFSQNLSIEPAPIFRGGDYHETVPDTENPSATALRALICQKKNWTAFLPKKAASCFDDAQVHTIHAGERAVLGKLRTMSEAEFATIPHGSEGLWRKLMRAAGNCATLEDVFTEVKSKRYTRTRINRMVMCAFLGITQDMLTVPVPYVRVLALNTRGREILKIARKTGNFPNIGETIGDAYEVLENRCADLYGLFSEGLPERPGLHQRSRIYYEN